MDKFGSSSIPLLHPIYIGERCHKFPSLLVIFIRVLFFLYISRYVTTSPVISDLVVLNCLCKHLITIIWLPPPHPSLHLQLIPSLDPCSINPSPLPFVLEKKSDSVFWHYIPVFPELPVLTLLACFHSPPASCRNCLPDGLISQVGFPANPLSDLCACVTDIPVLTLPVY